MKRLFLFLPVFLVLAGCVQNASPTPTPSASPLSDYTEFVSTQEEVTAMSSGEIALEDELLLEANQEFMKSQEGAKLLNNLKFDCDANKELYQKNLDQLQSSITKGSAAVEVIAEAGRKQAWIGYFAGLQAEKDSAQSDLDELCPA